jgi:C-terminal processing protease CtpA/Prc
VLINGASASAGEVAIISFIGRPLTRTFGVPTCGLTTGNSAFLLADQAVLNLATAIEADRSMTKYGGRIVPDETIDDSTAAVSRAVAWLESEAAPATRVREPR